ncbi:hypothetical protein [Dictyobacter kobayashii]|uniref:Cardiolipin synthase N-terminal domain-containing protein n=1 Tax=Dictyobacter kobayashii TaxID=2014872 RepID=A0A402ADZ8_9CHLR|nr:hypothetical protein [Dictyobacter kobayashii]GCE17316.1 hypothetical protein KDK_11160 [Dictyobacter kobayashii]
MNPLIVLPIICTLLAASFWLWMAWDLGGNTRLSSTEKTYWIAAFLFLNIFAAVFYYVYEYRTRR